MTVTYTRFRWPLLALVWLLSLSASAQTLHVLLFADTKDPTIGEPNLKIYSYLTQNLVPAMATQGKMTLNLHSFYDDECRLDKLDATINALSVGPDDVIFFFFAGHGWNNRQNDYPSLIFGNANTDRATLEANSRNLIDIYRQLRNRNPRLTIVVGEACNKERSDEPLAPTNSRKADIMSPAPYSARQFQNLFRAYRGGVAVASSKRGQYSYTDPKGGWFSLAWQNATGSLLTERQTGTTTWPIFLANVVSRTEATARDNNNAQQNPLILNELAPCPTCLVGTTPAPAPAPTRPTASNVPCKPVSSYVNETALAGIREDLLLLKKMYETIHSDNAEEYAEEFRQLYSNQRSFYSKLGALVFYESSQMPERCRPEFERNIAWVKESTKDILERYDTIHKYDTKPMLLVAQARGELPSLINRLEEIRQRFDK